MLMEVVCGAKFHYRLLVIDDEALSRELLENLLSDAGYEIVVAKDGFAALAQMRGALPDLIIVDLKMPNMSGFEFLSIRSASRSLGLRSLTRAHACVWNGMGIYAPLKFLPAGLVERWNATMAAQSRKAGGRSPAEFAE